MVSALGLLDITNITLQRFKRLHSLTSEEYKKKTRHWIRKLLIHFFLRICLADVGRSFHVKKTSCPHSGLSLLINNDSDKARLYNCSQKRVNVKENPEPFSGKRRKICLRYDLFMHENFVTVNQKEADSFLFLSNYIPRRKKIDRCVVLNWSPPKFSLKFIKSLDIFIYFCSIFSEWNATNLSFSTFALVPETSFNYHSKFLSSGHSHIKEVQPYVLDIFLYWFQWNATLK